MTGALVIGRRSALIGAVSSLFIPPSIAATLPKDAGEKMSAEERRDFHLAEYQRASQELDANIDRWSVSDTGEGIVVTGIRISCQYAGDGFYDCWAGRPHHSTLCINHVRLTSDVIDGYRSFLLTPWPAFGSPTKRLIEPVLELELVRKCAVAWGD